MPYIPSEDRFHAISNPKTMGELNYKITCEINDFLEEQGLSYDNINGVVGVLENVKMELTRRLTSPYEDIKIAENGDVYSETLLTILKELNNGS